MPNSVVCVCIKQKEGQMCTTSSSMNDLKRVAAPKTTALTDAYRNKAFSPCNDLPLFQPNSLQRLESEHVCIHANLC